MDKTEEQATSLPQNLQELYDKQLDFCKRIFAETEEIMPMWIGQNDSNEVYPITIAELSDENKSQVVGTIREIFENQGCTRYVSMIESWMVLSDRDKYHPGLKPSDHPERMEVVIIEGRDKNTGEALFGWFEIIRKEGEKPTLAEFHKSEAVSVNIGGDAFANILGTKDRTLH